MGLHEIEMRLQPSYEKMGTVGMAIRNAVQKGFAPAGYNFVHEQRRTLASLNNELTQALHELDDMNDPSIREKKRAMTQKIERDVLEADQLDKLLQHLLQLFQILRL